MERARRWQRVSTGDQDEAKQLADIDRWIANHDYSADGRDYVVHSKSAYHGKQAPALERALADMEAGQYDVLVVWAADRIERRGALAALQLAARVRLAGGRIEYVKDAYLNAVNEMSDVMLAMAATLARQESQRKSQRAQADIESRKHSGSAHGRAPWGYQIEGTKDAKRFVPTPTGRQYIPEIFQRIIDGASLRAVAGWLTIEGVDGKTWNEAYIAYRLIKNQVYYGERRNGGNLHTEALVSPTVWHEANAALASRIRYQSAPAANDKPLLLPVCGNPNCNATGSRSSPMYRIISGGHASRRAYYRCSGTGAQRKGCGAPLIPVEELDDIVSEAMLADLTMHREPVFVPGDDHADAIRKLRLALDTASSRSESNLLWDQIEALETQPQSAARWDLIETPETEAEYFDRLTPDQRRTYLARKVVRAYKDQIESLVVVSITPR